MKDDYFIWAVNPIGHLPTQRMQSNRNFQRIRFRSIMLRGCEIFHCFPLSCGGPSHYFVTVIFVNDKVIKGSILQKCRLKPFLWGHSRGLNEVSMQYIVGLAAILLHYQTWHVSGHIICLFHFIKQTLFYEKPK